MNILTFDIEDWFHINFEKSFNDETVWANYTSRIEYNTDVILNILDEKKIKATFFCLGWVARKYPSLVRKICSFGHEVGSHSDIHNLASQLSEEEFSEDLKKSIDSIEDITGEKVKIFRAPAFSIGKSNIWAFHKLVEKGIEIDCSVFPAKHDFGGFEELGVDYPFVFTLDGASLKEFPMSTYPVFGQRMVLSGGGYFRFFPYWFISHYMKNSRYNICYFHPRDIDRYQPTLSHLDFKRKFKSYYGLKRAKSKFERLLSDFEFVSLMEADALVNWEEENRINIQDII
jgi:polysaccharide deacetylase family protein (PEP-CTERM system associated)